MSASQFDYIIVGAGAAGCVLANRLSADPTTRVLVLEAGPDYPPGHEPAAIRDPYPIALGYPEFSWANMTAEVGADLGAGEPRFSRRYLQGFGVGGGSNIQGMVALRSDPADYEGWQAAGAVGWGWEAVLPYFRRLERDLDFDGPLHGQEGPIPIRRIKASEWAPFSRAFADCVTGRGYPLIEDLNADFRSGVGPLPMANLPHQRISAAMGYLDASVRRRANLAIRADSHVMRIELQGRKAIGVTSRTPNGTELLAAHEVILCAGALSSPAILMRSGIGPGQHLQDHGIDVIHDLAGVGQHLMNHVGISLPVHLRRHAAQPSAQRGFGQCCLRLSSGVEGPENDLLMAPINKTAWHPLGRRIGAIAVEVHKVHSRGEVRLRSRDSMSAPDVKFNLLQDERDLARLTVGLRLCFEILADPRMATVMNEMFIANNKRVQALWKHSIGNWAQAALIASAFELAPLRRLLLGKSKVNVKAMLQDSGALRQWALARANPPHHVSCTCRMGRDDDPGVVVDSQCRVREIENLRVVDASIMPTLVRANTHLPVLMIAEKMSDEIRTHRIRNGL